MKTPHTKESLIQKTDRITLFIEGVGTGLLLAYVISQFAHPLPDAVLFSAVGIMVVAAWLPVLARRKSHQQDSI
jgi:hypothetical protein